MPSKTTIQEHGSGLFHRFPQLILINNLTDLQTGCRPLGARDFFKRPADWKHARSSFAGFLQSKACAARGEVDGRSLHIKAAKGMRWRAVGPKRPPVWTKTSRPMIFWHWTFASRFFKERPPLGGDWWEKLPYTSGAGEASHWCMLRRIFFSGQQTESI